MKLSLFATLAVLGLSANASHLGGALTDYEQDDFELSQIDLDTEADNVVKVNIPECQGKPDPDALIMEAVNELGSKSADMAKALKLAFARSARLAATRTMEVKGCISLTPKITEPTPAPKPSTVNIEGGGCCGSAEAK